MVNPADTPDDDALVRLIRDEAGRPAGARALNDLLDRWQRRIYLWAWKRMRDREEALDLTQDCLVLMTRGLAGYEPRGQFGAWVFTIVRHRCLSAVRPRVLARDPDLDLETLVGPGRANVLGCRHLPGHGPDKAGELAGHGGDDEDDRAFRARSWTKGALVVASPSGW